MGAHSRVVATMHGTAFKATEQVNRLVRNGRLIATTADSAFAAFLQNWCLSLEVLGIEEYIVLAHDAETFELLAEMGLQDHAIFDGANLTAASSTPISTTPGRASAPVAGWYSDRYKRLMGSRPARILKLFLSGDFDLLFTDLDVVWRRSPWPELYRPTRRHCQVQAMAARSRHLDQTAAGAAWDYDAAVKFNLTRPVSNCEDCLNAGFIFFTRTASVTDLLERWAVALSRPGVQGYNQKWLNYVLTTGGRTSTPWRDAPVACQLDPSRFPNGHHLRQLLPIGTCSCSNDTTSTVNGRRKQAQCRKQRAETLQNLSAAHVNFQNRAIGKECQAHRLGLWLLSKEPVHNEQIEALSADARRKALQRFVPRYAHVSGQVDA